MRDSLSPKNILKFLAGFCGIVLVLLFFSELIFFVFDDDKPVPPLENTDTISEFNIDENLYESSETVKIDISGYEQLGFAHEYAIIKGKTYICNDWEREKGITLYANLNWDKDEQGVEVEGFAYNKDFELINEVCFRKYFTKHADGWFLSESGDYELFLESDNSISFCQNWYYDEREPEYVFGGKFINYNTIVNPVVPYLVGSEVKEFTDDTTNYGLAFSFEAEFLSKYEKDIMCVSVVKDELDFILYASIPEKLVLSEGETFTLTAIYTGTNENGNPELKTTEMLFKY